MASSKKSSSKRSSSKKSSSRKSLSSKNFNSNYSFNFEATVEKNNPSKKSISYKLILLTLSCLWNGMFLYYLYNLEDVSCKCIRDWRHDFMKMLSIIGIFISFLPLLGINTNSMINSIAPINFILGSIGTYCLYTYIGDLNDTKCSCAVDKQPKIHNFLNIWRYIAVGLYIFGIIAIIIIVFVLYNIFKKNSIISK